jgi:hypothetical protein
MCARTRPRSNRHGSMRPMYPPQNTSDSFISRHIRTTLSTSTRWFFLPVLGNFLITQLGFQRNKNFFCFRRVPKVLIGDIALGKIITHTGCTLFFCGSISYCMCVYMRVLYSVKRYLCVKLLMRMCARSASFSYVLKRQFPICAEVVVGHKRK